MLAAVSTAFVFVIVAFVIVFAANLVIKRMFKDKEPNK